MKHAGLQVVSVAVMLCVGCATGPAATPAATPAAPVPELISVPAGNTLLVTLRAKGAQIYTCTSGKDSGPYAWTLKAPQAELFDGTGSSVGKHGAGPSWEWNNGAQVLGEVLQKLPPKGPNIPWVLLKVKSSKLVSPYGAVTFIQRLDTVGGVAPAEGCDEAHVGAELSVAYTANYAFWGASS
jgi:hypothetical protein